MHQAWVSSHRGDSMAEQLAKAAASAAQSALEEAMQPRQEAGEREQNDAKCGWE